MEFLIYNGHVTAKKTHKRGAFARNTGTGTLVENIYLPAIHFANDSTPL